MGVSCPVYTVLESYTQEPEFDTHRMEEVCWLLRNPLPRSIEVWLDKYIKIGDDGTAL